MRRRSRGLQALLLCAFLVGPLLATAQAQEGSAPSDDAYLNYGRGPVPIKDNFLVSHRTLQMIPRGAEIVSEDAWEASLSLNWSNSFGTRRGRFFRIDGETVETVAGVSYGATDWLEVGIDIPLLWRGGGSMDSFIEGFHDLFGYSNGDRDRFDEDDYNVTITDDDGGLYDEDDEGFDLGNVTLRARANLTDGGTWLPAVTLGLELRPPTHTGDEISGSDGVDAGLFAYLSKHVAGDFYLHLHGGGMFYSDPDLGDIDLKDVRGVFGFAIEWACTDATSIFAQALYQSSQFQEGGGNLQNFAFTYALGMKTEPWKDVEFHLGLVENEFKYDNSADFGVQIGAKIGF